MVTRACAGWAVVVALGSLGCPHADNQLIGMVEAASYEGGDAIAVVHQRVWNRDPVCDAIDFDDNELWLQWSDVSTPEETSMEFLIGDHIATDEVHLAAAEDGERVYYSFGDFAEIVDRVGYQEADLGAGMGSAAFRPGYNVLALEGPGGLELVDMNDGNSRIPIGFEGSNPSWDPAGDKLLYERDATIYLFTFVSGKEKDLGPGRFPRYLDDGRIIAWADGDEGPGLYEVKPENGRLTYLGEPDAAARSAPWWRLAPDGECVLIDNGGGGFRLLDWEATSSDDWTMTSELDCG